MTEPAQDRPSFLPIVVAAAIVLVAVGTMWILSFLRTDKASDDGLVARAVVGQNDALQRENYPDFQTFTCVAQQGNENQVLADQRQSKSAKGNRFVDDVKDFKVDGDRATATVVYHFEKSTDDKLTTPMTFVRENDIWKVCSPGPR